MWDEVISKILIGVGEAMNSPGEGMSCTTATLLVHVAIPLEAHPGQLELGCKKMWPNHADKEMQDSSDIVSGGFWLIRRRLIKDKGMKRLGTQVGGWISVFGRKSGSGMPFAVGDVASRVNLGACDGATDFNDVLIAQPFGVANEGPFFVHLFPSERKVGRFFKGGAVVHDDKKKLMRDAMLGEIRNSQSRPK
ncbi:hypothetical protein C8J57DRAFT_1240765 [Mycena rebaudengoi]|nr:hypothetical protein C8J57DRAFT_1240765 [Mycena rebaudengoi]